MHLNTRLIANGTIAQLGPRDMQDYRDYVKRVTAIHKEAIQRLVDCEDTNLLELAELFEDVSNLYLDISEDIRARFISLEARTDTQLDLQEPAPRFATTNPKGATEG